MLDVPAVAPADTSPVIPCTVGNRHSTTEEELRETILSFVQSHQHENQEDTGRWRTKLSRSITSAVHINQRAFEARLVKQHHRLERQMAQLQATVTAIQTTLGKQARARPTNAAGLTISSANGDVLDDSSVVTSSEDEGGTALVKSDTEGRFDAATDGMTDEVDVELLPTAISPCSPTANSPSSSMETAPAMPAAMVRVLPARTCVREGGFLAHSECAVHTGDSAHPHPERHHHGICSSFCVRPRSACPRLSAEQAGAMRSGIQSEFEAQSSAETTEHVGYNFFL